MNRVYITSIVSLIVISLYSVSYFSLSQVESSNFSCKVEIIGGSPTMYPGQLAEFTTNVINGSNNPNYTWIVEE